MRVWLAAGVAACSSSASRVSETATATAAPLLAITNVNVVPMTTPGILAGHTVLVQGSTIVRVAPHNRVRLPSNAQRVDGTGLYLMPGLADMHVHIRGEQDFLSYLAHGVTTVFNLGGAYPEAPDLLRYRRELRTGARAGPTLYTSGPLVDGRPPIFPSVSDPAGSPEEAAVVVRRQREAGYDLVKTYNLLALDAFSAVTRTARESGIAVGGHIPQAVSVEHALAERIALVAHGTAFFKAILDSSRRVDEARLQAVVTLAKSSGTVVIPNLVHAAAFAAALADSLAAFTDPEARYVEPSVLAAWRATAPRAILRFNSAPSVSYPILQRLTRALDSAGVPLMAGSDFPAMQGLFPGASTIRDVRELDRAGLGPFGALRAATVVPGNFVRQRVDSATRFGQVVPGHRADLVLLRDNPLRDLDALDAMVGVVVRGRWLDRADLLAERERVARAGGR